MAYDLAKGLQGMGAWWGGKGPQYMAAQARQEEADAYSAEARRKRLEGLELNRQRAFAVDAFKIKRFIDSGRPELAMELVQNRMGDGTSLGSDMTHTATIGQELEQGMATGDFAPLSARLGVMVDAAAQEGLLKGVSAGAGASSYGAQVLVKDEEGNQFIATRKDDQPLYIPLAPNQPQAPVGKVDLINTTGESGMEKRVRDVEAALEKERGKQEIAYEFTPKIKRRVQEETSAVLADFKTQANTNEKSKLYAAYDTSMRRLASAFDDTYTGPFVGLLPAITANQQAADAAVTVITPILKELTRTPGEGTFSDGDREVLERMLPQRTDKPAVVQAKIEMIDSFVREKLGPSVTGAGPAAGKATGGGKIKILGVR